MSLASYQLLHSAMFFVLRVQRYCFFLKLANFYSIFLHFVHFFRKKLGRLEEKN